MRLVRVTHKVDVPRLWLLGLCDASGPVGMIGGEMLINTSSSHHDQQPRVRHYERVAPCDVRCWDNNPTCCRITDEQRRINPMSWYDTECCA